MLFLSRLSVTAASQWPISSHLYTQNRTPWRKLLLVIACIRQLVAWFFTMLLREVLWGKHGFSDSKSQREGKQPGDLPEVSKGCFSPRDQFGLWLNNTDLGQTGFALILILGSICILRTNSPALIAVISREAAMRKCMIHPHTSNKWCPLLITTVNTPFGKGLWREEHAPYRPKQTVQGIWCRLPGSLMLHRIPSTLTLYHSPGTSILYY